MTAAPGAEPVRLFIGSSRKNRVEEQVFIHTLRRHASRPLRINILDGDAGTVRWHDGREEPLPGIGEGEAAGATRFSLARFAIPQLCGFRGRAIYCDSDQIVFADPALLADFPLGDAVAAAVRVSEAICAPPYRRATLRPLEATGEDYFLTSVMLIDCARARGWDVGSFQRELAAKRIDYTGLMFFGRRERARLGLDVAPLPPQWNCLDALPADARLLHFTDLSSQPWLFAHNPTRRAWEAAFFEALDAGALRLDDVRLSRREGGLDARTAAGARLPRALRAPIHGAWTVLQNLLSPASWHRAAERALDRALPDTSWHWKRRPGVLRKLAWAVRLGRPGPSRRWLFVVYSPACERVLLPVARALASGERGVTVVLAGSRAQQRRLARVLRGQGVAADRSGLALMRAQRAPQGATVVLTLDHRMHYKHHRPGVDIADALRSAGARTVCLQHGGTREDSIASLASAAADRILVWGELAARELARRGVAPARIAVVGNPLHDRLPGITRAQAEQALAQQAPEFVRAAGARKRILLATTIQMEYAIYPDEQARYVRFLEHIYASVDWATQSLVVKLHPCDLQANRNLYRELLPRDLPAGAALILEAGDPPDTYTLLRAADVLLTRCSTVAEEALMLGVPVVAFDLEPDGPASGYDHLQQLGRYRRVGPEGGALRAALAQAGAEPAGANPAAERAIGLALDGGALRRTVEALRAG